MSYYPHGAAVAKREQLNVKLDSEVHRLVKLVSAWKNVGIAEYVNHVLRIAASKEWARIKKDDADEPEKKAEGDSGGA